MWFFSGLFYTSGFSFDGMICRLADTTPTNLLANSDESRVLAL